VLTDRIGGIIWDWNGTLLDDTQLCVQTMNELLGKRDLPLLTAIRYKNVFSFPVKEYYRKIGFDFEVEPFEIPALEFINRYNQQMNQCSLHMDSLKLLNHFHSLGIRQFVLSAMKQDALDECLHHHQISHFFDHVSGLDNHYAVSKVENGHQLISTWKLKAHEMVLIGDTVHDYEVATGLGCRCILISNGHQSKDVLQHTGALVLDELNQLLA
jgi:phosphoglycolate phosphatase